MRLIVDVATNRIVWFSEGDESLDCTDGTALVDYKGEWPTGIRSQNCWNWVLRDRKVVPYKVPPPVSLHETNKRHTEALLRNKINEKRKRIASDMMFEETIQIRKVMDAREYLNTGTSSWILARLAAVWGVGMKEAAQKILDEWVSKERMLLITEAQMIEYLHRISATTTSDEVLGLHEEITKI